MKQYIVDAFAEQPFTGNPAAVCPLEAWPEESLMQLIAAENNLSETAFIVQNNGYWQIRWFTPGYEIDLCGHATLASAYVIKRFYQPEASVIHFSSTSGGLSVSCDGDLLTLDLPSRPAKPIEPLPEAASALGAEILESYLSRDLLAVVSSEAVVKQLKPDFTALKNLSAGDGVIVTAPGETCDFVCRCFYPKCGVDEDPVTGSAFCNLLPYWGTRLEKTKLTAKQLSKRGAAIGGCLSGDRVQLSGKAVLFAVSELAI